MVAAAAAWDDGRREGQLPPVAAVAVHRPDRPVAVAGVPAVRDPPRVGRPGEALLHGIERRLGEVTEVCSCGGDDVDRLAVQVALQRAERDCAAVGRPAGEEPAARRMHRVFAPRPDVHDEDPFSPDPTRVAQVAAPRRAEDNRATVRREAWVEVESAAGARDASPPGAVCVHQPDVAVAGAIGDDASERRPLGGCDRPGRADGGTRRAAGGRRGPRRGSRRRLPARSGRGGNAATTRSTPRATKRS